MRPAPAVALLTLACLTASACASRAFLTPAGPAVPVPAAEAAAIWDSATRICAEVRVLHATVRPTGRLAGTRVRGVSLFLAVTADGRIGLEAVVGGQTQFTLKGTAAAATLWLPGERRVVTAPAAEILNAIVGLDVEPGRLLSVLSGCMATERETPRMDRVGDYLRVTTADTVVFLERNGASWRAAMGEFGELLTRYRRSESQVPQVVDIRTREGRTPPVDLSLTLRDVRLNPDLPDAAFTIVVPPDAAPASVRDLRLLGSTD